jgi:hypothetical protein
VIAEAAICTACQPDGADLANMKLALAAEWIDFLPVSTE